MKNPLRKEIKTGYARAAKITKRYAKSFYFASLFLPEEKKSAAYSIYTICRLSDEATDKDSSLLELSAVKRNIELVYSDGELNTNILSAFRHTVDKYSIPRHYFDKLIEGMYMDFLKNRYNDFSELEKYCYLVAGVVGMMMLKIFGNKEPAAEDYAVKLGIAMQLTNILRDIKEDYQRGRIYLPLDEMSYFGVSENDIASGRVSENFISLMQFQINRAKRYYAESAQGIALVPDKNSRFVICLIKETYSGILDEIEKNSYNVFLKRSYVGGWEKLANVLKAYRMAGLDAD